MDIEEFGASLILLFPLLKKNNRLLENMVTSGLLDYLFYTLRNFQELEFYIGGDLLDTLQSIKGNSSVIACRLPNYIFSSIPAICDHIRNIRNNTSHQRFEKTSSSFLNILNVFDTIEELLRCITHGALSTQESLPFRTLKQAFLRCMNNQEPEKKNLKVDEGLPSIIIEDEEEKEKNTENITKNLETKTAVLVEKKRANCHPELLIHAKGLCKVCYMKERRKIMNEMKKKQERKKKKTH